MFGIEPLSEDNADDRKARNTRLISSTSASKFSLELVISSRQRRLAKQTCCVIDLHCINPSILLVICKSERQFCFLGTVASAHFLVYHRNAFTRGCFIISCLAIPK